jgi:hypothetical protein
MMKACSGVFTWTVLPFTASCASAPIEASLQEVPDQRIGVYSNGRSVIVVDPERSMLRIDGESVALHNCSDDAYHCYKNESFGFHIVLPKYCSLPRESRPSIGGYGIRLIGVEPHGPVWDGLYVSDLSYRFAYRYIMRRGLFEIRYDKSGLVRFGPGGNGNFLNSSELEPITYRLPDDTGFLKCRRQ